MTKSRCDWCVGSDIYKNYHDTQWGIPVFDSEVLFAKFCLDSFQAGLSWQTILKKQDNFYKAFDNFNPLLIVNYDTDKVNALMNDAGIIRHKGKIEATIQNAKAYLKLQETLSFSDYLWSFVGHKPIQNHFSMLTELPSQTALSQEISKDLKRNGFKFCGATMVYAFMQAVGMVNDHLTYCFRYVDNT